MFGRWWAAACASRRPQAVAASAKAACIRTIGSRGCLCEVVVAERERFCLSVSGAEAMWCIFKVFGVCSERTGLLMSQDSLEHSSVPRLLLSALYKEGRSAFITDGMVACPRPRAFMKKSRNPSGERGERRFLAGKRTPVRLPNNYFSPENFESSANVNLFSPLPTFAVRPDVCCSP